MYSQISQQCLRSILLKPFVVRFQLNLESISVLDTQVLLCLIVDVAQLLVDEVYFCQKSSPVVVELECPKLQDVLMKLDFPLQNRVCLQST